jgi:hypothetical protein
MVELVPQVFFVAGKIRESLKLSVDGDGDGDGTCPRLPGQRSLRWRILRNGLGY